MLLFKEPKLIILLVLLVLFSACEETAVYEGNVITERSKKPLSEIKVEVIINNNVMTYYGTEIRNGDGDIIGWAPILTNHLGKFKIEVKEGCSFGCPKYKLRFSGEGYISHEIEGKWGIYNNMLIELKEE